MGPARRSRRPAADPHRTRRLPRLLPRTRARRPHRVGPARRPGGRRRGAPPPGDRSRLPGTPHCQGADPVNPSTPTAAAFRPVAVGRSAPEPGESRGDRIVVIGAGVLGISTAVQLARHGAHVTVVTEEQVCSGASGRSLSWLNSAGDRTPEYHALRMAGIDRYRTLAMTVPESVDWLRFEGALMWAGEDESFVDTLRAEHAAGYDAQWVGPHEVALVTPGVAAEAVAAEGAIFNPGEGWVDLARLVAFLPAGAGRLRGGGRWARGRGHRARRPRPPAPGRRPGRRCPARRWPRAARRGGRAGGRC